ncbi:hypothetical protein Galf_1405 [Gallionella capsiferriformans ES-2]|uniref:Uncharacterized protein n=1 Tax=Gallionella capsiferriformans (strain ES-2) TaxID=395494 RepID=D9SFY4_GALCS|nr:hypothetical protein Galf_1405 [Gallionella capsiferriformans ES-2]
MTHSHTLLTLPSPEIQFPRLSCTLNLQVNIQSRRRANSVQFFSLV